jgi:hypothetical protein
MSHCAKDRLTRGSSLFWRYFLEGMSLPDLYSYRPLRRGRRLSQASLIDDLEAVGRDFRAAIKFEMDEADGRSGKRRGAVKSEVRSTRRGR